MKIAYVVSDNGDGSASVRWFKNAAKAQAVVDNDLNCDQFGQNEGSINTLTLPDDFDLDSLGLSEYAWDDDDYNDDGSRAD